MAKYNRLKTSMKVYDLWPGNNTFYFNGRVMLGPTKDRCVNALGWIINIALFLINFFIFGRFFTGQVAFLPWLGLYQYIIVLICYFMVQFTDPGIIPSKKIQLLLFERVIFPYNIGNLTYQQYLETHEDDQQITQNRFRTDCDTEYSLDTVLPEEQFQELKEEFVYCKTCEIYRPPKSSHCSSCNNCIELNDHHCQFLRNCIGKRNFTLFIIFVVQLGVLLIICQFGGFYFLKYIIYWAIGSDNTNSGNGFLATLTKIVCYMMFAFSVLVLAGMIFLVTLQSYLWYTGKTTKELYRSQDKKLSKFMEQKYDIIFKSRSLIDNIGHEITDDEYELFNAKERLTNLI